MGAEAIFIFSSTSTLLISVSFTVGSQINRERHKTKLMVFERESRSKNEGVQGEPIVPKFIKTPLL